jgi:molybdopterin-guanine dinucleotide biosynthesis protein A
MYGNQGFRVKSPPDWTLLVLAGGRGRRLGGIAKGLIRLPSGETVVEHLLSLTDGPRLVSTNDPQAYERLDVPLVADLVPERGAPGGVVTGLAMATTEWVVVVACDMPLVTREMIDALLERRHAGVDVVCFTRDGELEPLLGCFRRTLCHDWAPRLDGHPSMKELISSARLEVVESSEPHRLTSLNSPHDGGKLLDV